MRGLERSLERVALDSSVLIEIVAGSQSVKRLVEDIARGLIEAYTSSLNMVEVLYITCRMWGKEEALRRFSKLLGITYDCCCGPGKPTIRDSRV
jgi:predicted nucleic acid-binding protein